MKNRYITMSIVALTTLLLFSCREDNFFEGKDNRLLYLELTVNGQQYRGEITPENEIVLLLPVELDLSNATVSYTISENATILPEPSTITNWNSEQVFNVFAHNGTKRTYAVRIIRQLKQTDENVLLTTDDEVKTFVEKNIGEVKGSLTIGNETGPDSITNIDALTYLSKVGYTLTVNPTYKGKDLSGLRNLTQVGSIVIKENPFLTEVTLKSLKTVSLDMTIASNGVRKLSLPELKQVHSVNIAAHRLTDIGLPMLQKASHISIKGNSLGTLKLKELQHVASSFYIAEVAKLTSLHLPELSQVGDDFSVNAALLQSLKLDNG